MLVLASCTLPIFPVNSFVDVPADASCRTLARALGESGWGSWEYLTVEETWLIHRQGHRGIPARERYAEERPVAWAVELRCGDEISSTDHQLSVRTCVSGGRSFGVIDPQEIRAIYPELAPGTFCGLRISSRPAGRRRWTQTYSATTVESSARPLLFTEPDGAGAR
jgi:hypothetical protein